MLNGFKSKFLNKFWCYIAHSGRTIFTEKKEHKFSDVEANFSYSKVNAELDRVSKKWPPEEFVVTVKGKVTFEPLFGMGLFNLRLIEPYSVAHWGTVPSIKDRFNAFFKKKKKYSKAVIFDYNLGTNYFHFFNDVLTKLYLIDAHRLEDLPLLVSRRLFETNHFQFFYRHFDFVKNRPWAIIENKQYIEVHESWLLKPMGYHFPYMTNLKQLVFPFLRPDAPKKRIFLNRSSKAGRTIRNFEELVPILNSFNFTIIDAAAFTMEEQLALFSSLSHLVAIHGAGNTNLLFSDSSVRFLEIMPANKIASHYYWLSNALGIAFYDILLGDDIKRASSGKETDFNIDPREFKLALEKLVSE